MQLQPPEHEKFPWIRLGVYLCDTPFQKRQANQSRQNRFESLHQYCED
jgi:hypothetical protein